MDKNEKIFLIYAYEIDKYAYIGLTKDLVCRHRSHCSKIVNDTLYRFCDEYGYEIPEPKILEVDLTWIEAQAKEGDWIKFYSDNGFNIINKGETGVYKSSVGTYDKGVVGHSGPMCKEEENETTYEECYCIAKKYNTKKDFKIENLNIYLFAKKMGWVNDYAWLKTENIEKNRIAQKKISYMDYEKMAKQCKTKTEFSLKYPSYYKWGLKRNLNDKLFIKVLKTKYKVPEEFVGVDKNDVIAMIDGIQTKTELHRKNTKLYNYCRHNNWLNDIFDNKEKTNEGKWGYNKVIKYNIEDINENDLIEIPSFKKLYIDIKAGKIFRKLKTKINELVPTIDDYGMLYFSAHKINGDKKVYPYHKYLRLALNYSDYNCVIYLDGNYSNIELSNLKFIKCDIDGLKQIHMYYNNYVDKHGNVYNSVDETLNKAVVIRNGKKYIGQYAIDNLVYSKFVHPIKENVIVEHYDGDFYNNEMGNLFIKKEIISDVEIVPDDNKHVIILFDENGEKHVIGKIWSGSIANDIKRKLQEYLRTGKPVKEWFNDFKDNVYNNYIKIDVKLYTDKIRTESCGCYWFEARKCWKSKIYYKNKECTLGYFDTFEQGKMLYEMAVLAIKYNCFDSWFKNIKTEREIIKSCKFN